MIVFKNIRYKNFLSSGNSFTEIDLRKSKSTLVVGHNGAGKSTMLDALSFSITFIFEKILMSRRSSITSLRCPAFSCIKGMKEEEPNTTT